MPSLTSFPSLPFPPRPRSEIHVLVIDDLRSHLDAAFARIDAAAFGQITLCSNATEELMAARRLLAPDRTEPVVIVTDIHMPDWDGTALACTLYAEMQTMLVRHAPIIGMTSDTNEQTHQDAREMGCDALFLKSQWHELFHAMDVLSTNLDIIRQQIDPLVERWRWRWSQTQPLSQPSTLVWTIEHILDILKVIHRRGAHLTPALPNFVVRATRSVDEAEQMCNDLEQQIRAAIRTVIRPGTIDSMILESWMNGFQQKEIAHAAAGSYQLSLTRQTVQRRLVACTQILADRMNMVPAAAPVQPPEAQPLKLKQSGRKRAVIVEAA